MATVNFLIKGKGNPATIYLRFRHGRAHDYTKNAGKIINPKDWSNSKKMPHQRGEDLKNLTAKLRNLSEELITSFNNTSEDKINGEWVERKIKQINNPDKKPAENNDPDDLLLTWIQNLIDTANTRENSKGRLGLSKSRINSYKNLFKIIKTYQGRKKIRVKDVDVTFGKLFLNWMLNKKHYSESYAKKKIDDLKTVCSDAQYHSIQVSPQLKRLKGGKTKKKFVVFLNPEELKKIRETDLGSSKLENARKWLLLGCQIGQRGGDLLKLNEDNILIRNGLELIELEQQKTGKFVTIPVLPETKEIIKEGLPYPISSQNFNKYIKEICQLAGFDQKIEGYKITMVDEDGNEIPKDEKGKYIKKGSKRKIYGLFPKYDLVASHICRISFATNLYGILPTPLIIQITGHSTEKEFLGYIGKSSLDYAQLIADFYSEKSGTT